MLPLLSAAQMRACDEYTINEKHVPSQHLMERAARAAIEVLRDEAVFALNHKTRIIVLCGSGNNGGDGFAMARFLFNEGLDVTVCYAGTWQDGVPHTKKMSAECARQYTLWYNAGGQTLSILPELRPDRTIVVDALFGIGLCREITGLTADWIEKVNESVIGNKTPVLAVDVPSGVHADTGKILGTAIRATVTATIAYPKTGLLLYPAAAHIGKLRVCDIGITTEALDAVSTHLLSPDDLSPILHRPAYANKGTFGRVLVIGGFPGMSGAPYFAAKSAYRAGAGLVEFLTAEANRTVLQTLLPEAVLSSFDPQNLPDEDALTSLLSRADSVVLGCGLGTSDAACALTEAILRLCIKPLVLDADALNLIAKHKHLQSLVADRTAPTVLTPHLGEAARLLACPIETITDDLFYAADALAQRYGAICVLKDTRTIVADGQSYYLQSHGNSGMATGGSGDCLAGLIGSLLAQHRHDTSLSPTFLASLGVLIHAMAGDHAATKLGEHALMANDLADAIGHVLHVAAKEL